MASLDSLPADQKAVLSLVLQRGKSFDQIAALLSVDRARVRQRALDGLGALGPQTSVAPLKLGLITDYLLGQLPQAVAATVRDSLAANPPERAWARIVAAEIGPLSTMTLPEIPAAGATSASPAQAPARVPTGEDGSDGFLADDEPFTTPPTPTPAVSRSWARSEPGPRPSRATTSGAEAPAVGPPPSSRRGGAILLSLIVMVVVVVVVVLLVTGGSSKQKPSSAVARSAVTTTTGTSSLPTSSSGTSTTASKITPLRQISLISPTGAKGQQGAADVVRAGGQLGIVLVATGLAADPASSKDAYGVWLYNAGTKAGHFLGFDKFPVTSTGSSKGALEVESPLPANATPYNELLLTLESTEHPTHPGTIVLEGTFSE